MAEDARYAQGSATLGQLTTDARSASNGGALDGRGGESQTTSSASESG